MNYYPVLAEAVRLQYLAAMGVSSWLPVHDRLVTHGAVWQPVAASSHSCAEVVQSELPKPAPPVVERHLGSQQSLTPHMDQASPLDTVNAQAKEQTWQICDALLPSARPPEPAKPVAQKASILSLIHI